MNRKLTSGTPKPRRIRWYNMLKTQRNMRESILIRAAELESLTVYFCANSPVETADSIAKAVRTHLDAARQVAGARRLLGGAFFERAYSNLDAAEALLLNIAPAEYIRRAVPSVEAFIERNLRPDDPRRISAAKIARQIAAAPNPHEVIEKSRGDLVAGMRAASSALSRRHVRFRSFRGVAYLWAVGLAIAAATIVIVAAVDPFWAPLCFRTGSDIMCPMNVAPSQEEPSAAAATASSWADYLIIEMIGLLSGAIGASLMLRHIRGTATPYSLPVAMAASKLPAGALSAVFGLWAVQAGFFLGFPGFGTQSQLLAWAALFGFAGQQILTRPTDQIGGMLLAGGDPELGRMPISEIANAWLSQIRGMPSGG